ncbi:MAG: type II CAAX endopeptidase family protein [Erysipelotrichaceae bacterium]
MRKDKNLWEKSPLSKIRIFLVIFNYFFGYMFFYPSLLVKFTFWIDPNASSIPPFYEFVVYTLVILITIVLLWPLLKVTWTVFKKMDKVMILKTVGKSYLLMLGCNLIINLLITMITNSSTSMNQVGVEESLKATPLLITFATLCFAPIVEEGVFRGAIFRPLRSKYCFYIAAIVSSLCFGFIHIYSSLLSGNFHDLLYLFSYAVVGFFTCRVYEKTGNLSSSMLFHFFNNLLAVLVIL